MSQITETVRAIIGEKQSEWETRTYTIEALPEHLDKIEQLFSWINSTRSGHSGSAAIFVDGDGAARVTIERKDGALAKFDEDEVHTSKPSVEYTVGLD